MKALTLSKNSFYQFIFVLCVAVPYLNNYELTFVVWLLSIVLSLRKSYSKTLLYQIGIFSAILLIAFFSSFSHDYKTYNFVRDITYLVKPIFGLLIGYQICRNYLKNPLRTVVNAGAIIACLHLVIVVWSLLLLDVRDIHSLRYFAGYFSDFEVYALVILIFNRRLGLEINDKTRRRFIVVIAISALFYLSRINFIQFVILAMAIKGYFLLTRRTLVILGAALVSVLMLYGAIYYINPKRNGKGVEAFLYKVKIAPIEPFKTKINKDDYKDFNDNYRSLENILTVQQNSSETSEIIFGKGLGSVVDLHTKVYLDDVQMEFISILHNGFMTVYLKSGLTGVFILVMGIVLLGRAKYRNPDTRSLNHLLTGTIIFLFFSYWVFMGFYFKADTKSILIGLFIAMLEKIRIGQLSMPASTAQQ